MKAKRYRTEFSALADRRYRFPRAAALLRQHGHWGPWHRMDTFRVTQDTPHIAPQLR